MVHKIYDKIFKIVAFKYPEEFINFALKERLDADIEVIETVEQEAVEIESIEVDVCVKVKINNKFYMVNLEAYDKWRVYIPKEVFQRNAFLLAKYDVPVISIVYILEGEFKQSCYNVIINENELLRFDYITLKVEGDKEKIGKYVSLAPFLLKSKDKKSIEFVLKLVKGDRFLEAISFLLLTHLGWDEKEVTEMIGLKKADFVNDLFEMPVLREFGEKLKSEGKIEGKIEGIKEGKIEGLKEGIEIALWAKFGTDGMELYETILKIDDLDKLKMIKEVVKFSTKIEEIDDIIKKVNLSSKA